MYCDEQCCSVTVSWRELIEDQTHRNLWGMIQNVLLMALSRLVFPTRSCPTTTSLTVELITGSSCRELRYWRTSAARSGKSDGMLMSGLPLNVMRRSRLRADTETGSCDSRLLFTRSSSSDVNRPMSTGNSTSALSLHCTCKHTSLLYILAQFRQP